MPNQRSLTDQLRSLVPVADKMGLYDASDYLRTVTSNQGSGQLKPLSRAEMVVWAALQQFVDNQVEYDDSDVVQGMEIEAQAMIDGFAARMAALAET